MNAGSGLSLGGRSSPVQQPHEEMTHVPTAVAIIRRILGVFIMCYIRTESVYDQNPRARQVKIIEEKRVSRNKPTHPWIVLIPDSFPTWQKCPQLGQARPADQVVNHRMHRRQDLQLRQGQ